MEKIMDLIGRNQPQYNTVTTTATVRDALYKMYCEHIDYLIVEENDKFMGLLTEHDVAGKVLFSDKPLQNTLVKEFMTTHVPVITAEDSLENAMRLLDNRNARFLAVYDGFNFQAIVSAQDVMREALKKRRTTYDAIETAQQVGHY